ncbi:MAG: AzlD domain-containing protein, partial [Burkholderiaceae bacterium]
MMQETSVWVFGLIIIGLGLISLATRASFYVLPASWQLPPRVERALRYAPACALAAIIVPEVVLQQGQVAIALTNDKLRAVIAAGVFFAFKRDMLMMMGVGMVVYTLLRL